MHLTVIGEDTGLGVGDNRIRFPRRPEPVYDLHPFIRHLIPEVVLVMPGEAEILSSAVVVGGHQV